MKFWYTFIILGLALFTISCNKVDQGIEKTNNINSVINDIKREFYALKCDFKLIKKYNDTLTIVRIPLWETGTSVKTDSSVFYYFPVVQKMVNGNSKDESKIRSIGFQEYIIIEKDNNDKLNFSIGSYLYNNIDRANELDKGNEYSLSMQDLVTGKVYSYYGASNNQYATGNNNRIMDPVCATIYRCEFYSTCLGGFVTTQTSAPNACECPTYKFSYCSPPGGGCVTNPQWHLIFTYTYEHCNPTGPPTPPPPPPPNNFVYARFEVTNEQFNSWYEGAVYKEERKVDVYLRFYTTAACTVPAFVDSSIEFFYNFENCSNISFGSGGTCSTNSNGISTTVTASEIYLGNKVSYQYQSYPDPYYGEVWDSVDFGWYLISGANYNHLPTYGY